MAKVHLNAIIKGITGRIGALVFYEWDGDTFVRPRVRQRDPKTPLQLDLRDAFGRGVRSWQALPEAEKAEWNRRANKRRTTGYHAYLSAYMRNRWDRAEAARLLMSQAKRQLRREGEELLYLLDSTSITLKGPGFDSWTQESRTRNTQGIKLHILYAGNEAVPVQHSLTPPNVNDIDEGVKLPIESGAVYVFDKGYCDYNWWSRVDAARALFVTRFKRNASLKVECTLPVPAQDAGIVLCDEIVRFANKHPRGGRKNHYQQALRRVTVARPDHDRPLVLATNDLASPAVVIAQRYRERWGIELFFKWIKQHLRIKSFLGRSENAVRMQILTALIAYLLLTLYRQARRSTGSLWTLLAEVRATLFQRPTVEAEMYRKRCQARADFASRQAGLFA